MFLIVKKNKDIDSTQLENSLQTTTCTVGELSTSNTSKYNGIIILGGDGTIIRTLSYFEHLPTVYAINYGTYGYLAPIKKNQVDLLTEALSKKISLPVINRTRMRIGKYKFINEVVYTTKKHKCGKFIISINKRDIPICGDSVIISTRTGSTGYNNSINGPFVLCDTLIVNVVAPNKVNFRPIVCDINYRINVKCSEDAVIIIDGIEREYCGENISAADEARFGYISITNEVDDIKKMMYLNKK